MELHCVLVFLNLLLVTGYVTSDLGENDFINSEVSNDGNEYRNNVANLASLIRMLRRNMNAKKADVNSIKDEIEDDDELNGDGVLYKRHPQRRYLGSAITNFIKDMTDGMDSIFSDVNPFNYKNKYKTKRKKKMDFGVTDFVDAMLKVPADTTYTITYLNDKEKKRWESRYNTDSYEDVPAIKVEERKKNKNTKVYYYKADGTPYGDDTDKHPKINFRPRWSSSSYGSKITTYDKSRGNIVTVIDKDGSHIYYS